MFEDLIKHIAALLSVFVNNNDKAIVNEGLCECTKAIKRINREIKSINTGGKQKLLASLRNIKSLRAQFKSLQKSGAGIRKETARDRVHWDDSTTAFNSRIRTGIITNLKHKDAYKFLADSKTLFRIRIKNVLKKIEAVKVNMVFGGEFLITKADKVVTEYKYFTTSNSTIYRDTNIDLWFDNNVNNPILKNLDEFQERDSGWALHKIVNLGVNINKFSPQVGSSYIELPNPIARKKACINVKNTGDHFCFLYSLLSCLYPVQTHSDRVSSYPDPSTVFNLKGIQFPMTIRQIPRFEKQNNISVNVYVLKKVKNNFITLPTYLTKDKKEKHVNLLLIQNVYEDDNIESIRYHYVWIKNMSRLVSSQLSNHKSRKYFCNRCFHYFNSQEKLNLHVEDCVRMNKCKVRMPTSDNKMLGFKNHKNKEKAPFIIYADLECVLKATNEVKKYQEHIPCSIGYYVKCSYDDGLSFYRAYHGEDCMKWFAAQILKFAEDLETVFLCPYDMDTLTQQQQLDQNQATICHICQKPFSSSDKKVRDHNHLIPENNYRGVAHEGCNINFKDSHTVPIVFHNLSGYDSHFIIKNIASDMEGRVDLLPVTKEKYISFTKHISGNLIKFRFIDSFRFMNSSLDKLASYLTDFNILKSEFKDIPDEQLDLLKKKGVFPYDFMDSFDKFNYTSLPARDEFYNRLEGKGITQNQYTHAQNVWEKFKCQNLLQYTLLYMKVDICLLAQVYESFRESCLKTYGLDPAHYFTLPGYTWDCMLKHTGIQLELLTDIDMLLFVERGIRGGLSQCSKRRVKANNRYMSNYDSSKPSSYLMYFDINNQYGWAMSQSLPYGAFEWSDSNIDVTSIPDDALEGYILEVDLEYPRNLHNIHRDLPFCPEHRKPPGSKEEKLMATLYSKSRYVIHYRNLKQALANGSVLSKIHRVLKFKQSKWLKSYIDLNTELRKQAMNEFEKNLFKLMNNSVFGKTMENIRKYSNIKLVTKWIGRYGAENLIAKPEFKSSTIFEENLVAIELNKLEIYFDKPIYVGMCILDLAKTTIYDFHYGYMKQQFGAHCIASYTDTDSLIYEIKDDDVYEIIRRDCHQYFDTSDYAPNNIYGIPQVNKKVLGLMKDENNGQIMTDFVGLRSKLYTMKLINSEDINEERSKLKEKGFDNEDIEAALLNICISKKAKGVKKSVLKNCITFHDYIECLENFKQKCINQNLIKSEKHNVCTIEQIKIGLSPYDDKRYIRSDSYDTLPWGHYSLNDTIRKRTHNEIDGAPRKKLKTSILQSLLSQK